MLTRQLLTLTISTLIGFTPVNFYRDRIEFPFTRNDSVYWTGTAEVYSLDRTTPVNAQYTYMVVYSFEFYCNSACYYSGVAGGSTVSPSANVVGYNIDNNHVRIVNYSRIGETTSPTMLDKLAGITWSGGNASNYTYTSETSIHTIGCEITMVDNIKRTYNITFPAVTEGMVLSDIDSRVDELSDWYYVQNFLKDKDVNPTAIQTVSTYVNNGDYSSAVSYIQNYYTTNSYTENYNNESVVNNYNTKETGLQTVTNQEHQFTLGIENQFENQIQLVNTNNSIIENVSWQRSANWVTDKFNRFTNGNAFGSLLGFSLLIGFAMAIIGRVLK